MMWDAPERKKARLKYYGRQILVNAVIIAILLYTQFFRSNSSNLIIYAVILVVITILQLVSGRINAKKQAEKITANKDNSSFFLETTYDISDTGIIRKDENIEARFQWSAFIRKEETEEYYFLFISSVQALIFPKRIFKTMEERKQFEKTLSLHLSFDAEVGHWVKE